MDATDFGPENLTRGATNDTTMQPIGFGFGIFLICIFAATFIVGFIGNGLVIFLTLCRMKTTVNSIWFLNLAIADFIFILSFVIIPFIVYFSSSVYMSIMFILFIMMTLNHCSSIFFPVIISLDRYLCTWMVVWAKNNRTVLKARIICMIVWVLSIGYCIPLFTENVFTDKFLAAYAFLMGCLVPFLIIASSNLAIGVRIKRLKMGKQLKSYRVLIAVILTFFICFFPSMVCLIAIAAEIDILSYNLVLLSVYLVFLNSSLNPILYVFMCEEFKKKLKQSLLLVLETAFAEDHLDFRGREIQKDEQNHKNKFELLDMKENSL